MFYSLTGNIIYRDENSVALSCGGVSFRCFTTYNTLSKIGGNDGAVTLFTHLNVREDSLDLYGFYNIDELDVFKLLIGVSGIGPKAALSILSEFTPDLLAVSVASGDSKSLTKAQGIGAKLAQRVVLELKDRLGSYSGSEQNTNLGAVSAVSEMSNTQSAVSALVELGYSQTEATLAVSKLSPSLSEEELIKAALKSFISFL
ncbi:MAG: Holliday junction branch migration protein RuvA [Clostridiales bacterium]|jgi:Holliday junction DNA helicase RuvA|nr:Holliday junction branch migration protein RuvA [Clostridiales bacterium]